MSKGHLSLVHSSHQTILPAVPVTMQGHMADAIGGRMMRLLTGYVRGGCNNHDLLMRAVGLCEAHAIALGVAHTGEQIADQIDYYLARVQCLPEPVLRLMQMDSVVDSMRQQLLVMMAWFEDHPDAAPEMS